MSLDLLLGYELDEIAAGQVILGLTAGVAGVVRSDLVCPGNIRFDGIDRDFPVLFSGGALVGIQRGSASTVSGRIMAGPTYYQAHNGGGALGIQGRLELATPTSMHTALVASLRHSTLPNFRGESVGITSVGLGIRIR